MQLKKGKKKKISVKGEQERATTPTETCQRRKPKACAARVLSLMRKLPKTRSSGCHCKIWLRALPPRPAVHQQKRMRGGMCEQRQQKKSERDKMDVSHVRGANESRCGAKHLHARRRNGHEGRLQRTRAKDSGKVDGLRLWAAGDGVLSRVSFYETTARCICTHA